MVKDIWSDTFLGNIYKLRAFNSYYLKKRSMANCNQDGLQMDDETDKEIINDLEEAQKLFIKVRNQWGIGLVNYLKGMFYIQKSKWNEITAR